MTRAASRGLTFVAGVALGALVSALLLQGLDHPQVTVEASQARARSEEANSTALPLPGPAASEVVASVKPPHRESDTRVPLAQADDAVVMSDVLAELNRAYARGEIADEDLVQLLLGVLVEHGSAEKALELVNRLRPDDPTALVQVAVALSQQGKRELAQELIARAMALTPENEWVINEYAGADPAGALPYFLARLAAQPPPGDLGLRMEIAQLYANCGRLDEARAQVDALLRQDPRNSDALQFLSNLDPASAERIVRDLAITDDPNGNWRGFLFQLVVDQGRTEEALEMLERERAAGVDPSAGDYGAIAQKYLELEKTDAAVELWARAFDAEQGDPDSWTAALQLHAPTRLLKMLEARVAQGANDEFWGALGDSYWRAERHAEALNAWREASRMDPEDGEWTSKVAAVEAGTDPL